MPRELEELPQPNSLEVLIEALPEPREVTESELAPLPREVRGEKASAQTLKSFKPTLTFKKKVASLQSGVEPE